RQVAEYAVNVPAMTYIEQAVFQRVVVLRHLVILWNAESKSTKRGEALSRVGRLRISVLRTRDLLNTRQVGVVDPRVAKVIDWVWVTLKQAIGQRVGRRRWGDDALPRTE